MFDYQAGEKYKLTLIMVAIAGALAGVFFTILLIPTDAPQQKHRQSAKYLSDPDITGFRGSGQPGAASASAPFGAQTSQVMPVDPLQAKQLIDAWLPLAWDLSAGSARQSQEKALAYMTPDCASSYKQNIWTDAVANQIEQAGVQSTFSVNTVDVGGLQADGSIVVTVQGRQSLGISGKNGKSRDVKVEYLIKQLPEGLRIAGVSEVGPK